MQGKVYEVAECRECGMKLGLDSNGEHPVWFEYRKCVGCWLNEGKMTPEEMVWFRVDAEHYRTVFMGGEAFAPDPARITWLIDQLGMKNVEVRHLLKLIDEVVAPIYKKGVVVEDMCVLALDVGLVNRLLKAAGRIEG